MVSASCRGVGGDGRARAGHDAPLPARDASAVPAAANKGAAGLTAPSIGRPRRTATMVMSRYQEVAPIRGFFVRDLVLEGTVRLVICPGETLALPL